MTDRPVVLLDVDGVLNAFPATLYPQGTEGFQDFRSKPCNGYEICYSPQMGERLISLDADFVWLTTWEHRANEFIGPLFGWDAFPVLEGGEEWYRRGWWKTTVAEKFIRKNPRPFIWIDDDLASEAWNIGIDWVRDQSAPFHTVSPLTVTGLLPSQLDEIEDFIAGLDK